jgi:hypothetical protein
MPTVAPFSGTSGISPGYEIDTDDCLTTARGKCRAEESTWLAVDPLGALTPELVARG